MSAPAFVEAVSFVAPGLPDWTSTRHVLRGEHTYVPSELPAFQPSLLPPNERRRASATVRMAFRVAEATVQASSIATHELATVFSSSDGDLAIAQRICTALAQAQRFISPTDFHNSVHNAAAGYWSIAALAKGPATAISAFDCSFTAGLLEAMGMVCIEQRATLLVAYDVPAPAPLLAKRSMQHAVGVGLVLTPQATERSVARITVEITSNTETACDNVELEALRTGNPAARALPLLALLANQRADAVNLAAPNAQCVRVHVVPHMEVA